MKVEKLAIAITFHYVEGRLEYLSQTVSQVHLFADQVDIHIFTNEDDQVKHLKILNAIEERANVNIEIHVPKYLGHPYLLTWSHFCIFRRLYNYDISITHYMYLEDDIYITVKNIQYWLRGRENMRADKLIPGFMRYEKRENSSDLYSSDVTNIAQFEKLPRFKMSDDYCFINLPEPYQGMYFLDRELMAEHLNGPSSVPEGWGAWGIRERAAAGLTFTNIPNGCYSRHFIGYDIKARKVDPSSLIHHIPNNYANGLNPVMRHHGRIRVADLIVFPD